MTNTTQLFDWQFMISVKIRKDFYFFQYLMARSRHPNPPPPSPQLLTLCHFRNSSSQNSWPPPQFPVVTYLLNGLMYLIIQPQAILKQSIDHILCGACAHIVPIHFPNSEHSLLPKSKTGTSYEIQNKSNALYDINQQDTIPVSTYQCPAV